MPTSLAMASIPGVKVRDDIKSAQLNYQKDLFMPSSGKHIDFVQTIEKVLNLPQLEQWKVSDLPYF